MKPLTLIAALVLTACAFPDDMIRTDNAGYRLPGKTADLDGITAIVTVRSGSTVNGTTLMPPGAKPGWANGGVCFVYLANTPAGMAALEHELFHCRNGAFHD